MKILRLILALVLGLSTLGLIVFMPATAALAPSLSSVNVGASGLTSADAPSPDGAVALTYQGTLTTDEAATLAYMREEEKLAHDVYTVLYAQWRLNVFQNIASSEQTHTDAIKSLLARYQLSDPAAGQGVGVFDNADLQALYDQLVAQGAQSLIAALRVGAAIEEIDILDLQEGIAQTDQADIRRVYENLMKGSRNHLRSFTSTLVTKTGQTYAPQYLTQAAYLAIVNTPAERGNAR